MIPPESPRAHVILPPLDGRTALTIVQVLENIIDAIWDAHRDAIDQLRTDLTAAPATLEPPAPLDDDIF